MRRLYQLILTLLTLFFTVAIISVITITSAYFYLKPQLPEIDVLKDVQLQVPLRVYSADNKLLAEFGEKKREPVKYQDIPEQLIQAVISAEDENFFHHPGVDYKGILRALVHLLKTGTKGQGGSTITMQVARNFFLSRDKTYVRKINEIFLSLKIEKELSKQEIMELYMNKIYLGHRSYGVAANVYYGMLELKRGADFFGYTLDPTNPGEFSNLGPSNQQVADDFLLTQATSLESISWFGRYGAPSVRIRPAPQLNLTVPPWDRNLFKIVLESAWLPPLFKRK